MATPPAAPEGITLSTDLRDVDWQSLQISLAADSFDNGRTPEQLRKSSENSYLINLHRLLGSADRRHCPRAV